MSHPRLPDMLPDHNCWWTNRRMSELTITQHGLSGFGVCRIAMATAAIELGSTLTSAQSADDEHTLDVSLGSYSGTLHDQCMPWFPNADANLVDAIVHGVLQQHANYLAGSRYDLSHVREYVRAEFKTGITLRIRTESERGRFGVRSYAANASWIERRLSPMKYFRVVPFQAR